MTNLTTGLMTCWPGHLGVDRAAARVAKQGSVPVVGFAEEADFSR